MDTQVQQHRQDRERNKTCQGQSASAPSVRAVSRLFESDRDMQ